MSTASPLHAAEIAPADLELAVRSLGFVDSMAHHSPVIVSVVYKNGDAESKAQAQHAAAIFARLPGPQASSIAAGIATPAELVQSGRRSDVLYILPGVQDSTVGDAARHLRAVSISNDPNCFNVKSCVLMVRAGARTEVVLDTMLAQDTGTSFSSVFLMMVKRR